MGGDGAAFWYTAKPMDSGAMFGSDEKFKGHAPFFVLFRVVCRLAGHSVVRSSVFFVRSFVGSSVDRRHRSLAVYFDSYDNDGARDNPVVSAMVSDGKKLFDHDTDGRYTRCAYCRATSCAVATRCAALQHRAD
jgi:hypothetical protein